MEENKSIARWKVDLQEQIRELNLDYIHKVDKADITGRRMYISSLIGAIEEQGANIEEIKGLYQNIVEKNKTLYN